MEKGVHFTALEEAFFAAGDQLASEEPEDFSDLDAPPPSSIDERLRTQLDGAR